jgi:integrase
VTARSVDRRDPPGKGEGGHDRRAHLTTRPSSSRKWSELPGEARRARDFGLRDLRAKGATDMYRADVDIRQIQRRLGHKSVVTTEIYLK